MTFSSIKKIQTPKDTSSEFSPRPHHQTIENNIYEIYFSSLRHWFLLYVSIASYFTTSVTRVSCRCFTPHVDTAAAQTVVSDPYCTVHDTLAARPESCLADGAAVALDTSGLRCATSAALPSSNRSSNEHGSSAQSFACVYLVRCISQLIYIICIL